MGALLRAPRLPQVYAGPRSPGAQPLLERASRSLTPWRVAIREETQLHEHARFSIRLPDDASDLSLPLPRLARCTPGPLQSGSHLCPPLHCLQGVVSHGYGSGCPSYTRLPASETSSSSLPFHWSCFLGLRLHMIPSLSPLQL